MASTTIPATAPRRGWFGRNWKWFVPVSLLLALVLGGGVGFFISFGPNLKLKNTQAYADTVREVMNSPRVKAALGDNIQVDTFLGMPSGAQEGRTIQLTFPIKGSKGRGDVASTSMLIDDKWGLGRLVVKTAAGELNLTADIKREGDDMPKFDPAKKGATGKTNDPPPDVNLDSGGDKAPDINLDLGGENK